MTVIGPYLADIWLFLIGFFLLYYAVTDGSDLGAGVISLLARDDRERGLIMGAVAATWHGNQTWLVLLGGMLFGAFPVFYSILLSSLYIPILVMLFGLIFRGVAFEFREHSIHKARWGVAFGCGSLLTTLAQGFALGGLLGGLQVENGRFAGSVWGWLTAPSALVAVGVLCGYGMLGANYLIMKTEGELQQRSRRYSLVFSILTLFISILVHFWAVATYPHIARKWTVLPDALYVGTFLLLAACAFVMFFHSLRTGRQLAPLLWNAAIILFSFVGLSVELYPNMIPQVISPVLTVRDAAASPKTLLFMLVVTIVIIPVILTYTTYEFWVFRGKVQEGAYDERESPAD